MSQAADFAATDAGWMLDWITGNGQEHRACQAIERADYEKARHLLEPLAARGSVYSLLALGWLYETGRFGPPDTDTALSYYGHAASQGSAEANRRMGQLLLDRTEDEKARLAFKHGAEAGNISCMYWLGKMLLEGRGGALEVKPGTDWLEAAAAQGHIGAKRKLLSERLAAASIFMKPLIIGRILALTPEAAKLFWKDPDSDKAR